MYEFKKIFFRELLDSPKKLWVKNLFIIIFAQLLAAPNNTITYMDFGFFKDIAFKSSCLLVLYKILCIISDVFEGHDMLFNSYINLKKTAGSNIYYFNYVIIIDSSMNF